MSQINHWRLHLKSKPEEVYRLLAAADGQAGFQAATADEDARHILLIFPDGLRWRGEFDDPDLPHRFLVFYFGSALTIIGLDGDGEGGTEVTVTNAGALDEDWFGAYDARVSLLQTIQRVGDSGNDLTFGDTG